MSLEEAIIEALEHRDNPPPNESCTCEWVILPLLHATGYARRDIHSRLADNNGQFPDYTLLPDTPTSTWYLEAKAWNVSLEDKHAYQALNYANQNGKRWVVLTNGFSWQLFDNYLQGVAAAKRVLSVQLDDQPGMQAFLRAVSKDSFLRDEISVRVTAERERQENAHAERDREREQAKRITLIIDWLTRQSESETSNLIRGIHSHLIRQNGLESAAPADVVAAFRAWRGQTEATLPTPAPSSPRKMPAATESVPATSSSEALPLTSLLLVQINGKETAPTLLILPDGSQHVVSKWVDLAYIATSWFYGKDRPEKPPLQVSGVSATRWFLSTSPYHKNRAEMRTPRSFTVGITSLYMDTDLTATQFLKNIASLCQLTGVSPTSIKIRVR